MAIKESRAFSLRINYENWRFLRRKAADHDTSMNEIINAYIEKDRLRAEKRLHDKD